MKNISTFELLLITLKSLSISYLIFCGVTLQMNFADWSEFERVSALAYATFLENKLIRRYINDKN